MELDPVFKVTKEEDTTVEKDKSTCGDMSASKNTPSNKIDNLDKKKNNLKKIRELRDIVNAAYSN